MDVKMTLDQLLSKTGVDRLRTSSEKTASEDPVDAAALFQKLAQRCRAASETTVDSADLTEKTAAVVVIAKTLAEIDAICGTETGSEKVAAPSVDVFIRDALAAGHAPDHIAAFLKEAGFLGRALHSGAGRAATAVGSGALERGAGQWHKALQDVAENGSRQQGNQMVAKLRYLYGDDHAAKLVKGSGAKLDHLEEAQSLTGAKPQGASGGSGASGGAKPAISIGIGGKQMGLTGQQAGTIGKGALLGAGAYEAGKSMAGGDEKKKHGGMIS